eukprot:CAMPEP_0181200090 /NCGR_PEP_ID=MMETSP1096-20121128/17556_1 /TAXON_ID=156174 ORGANISM="Chrysochromulina ericina, Strain CCMP281" /NCGR_SAMPLE_ID=MMETSP1096 /ASSEMBLY_ACC=CAM_ASM_000453 /LENGTH=133 /DNA_ID=CAMNT_0023290379 /DNA_START=1066 /DNA_END=1469 /DNA_ORIENTATION=+
MAARSTGRRRTADDVEEYVAIAIFHRQLKPAEERAADALKAFGLLLGLEQWHGSCLVAQALGEGGVHHPWWRELCALRDANNVVSILRLTARDKFEQLKLLTDEDAINCGQEVLAAAHIDRGAGCMKLAGWTD